MQTNQKIQSNENRGRLKHLPKPEKGKRLGKDYQAFYIFGRSERIRTFDPLHPMQVRYQTAPHSDEIRMRIIGKLHFAGKCFLNPIQQCRQADGHFFGGCCRITGRIQPVAVKRIDKRRKSRT